MTTQTLPKQAAASLGLLFCLPLLAYAANPAPPPVQIKAYAQHHGGNIIYTYEVINNSSLNIGRVEIGRRSFDAEENPELVVEPIGENACARMIALRRVYGVREPELSIEAGCGAAPGGGIAAPDGWEGHVSGEEDFPGTTIVWEVKQDSQAYILAGQSMKGFTVTLPERDNNYLTSHFFIISKYTGTLEQIDTTPPTLAVSATPSTLWPPNGKPVPVAVTITTQDDYDPNPEIKLESITATEPLLSGDIVDAQCGTDDRSFSLSAKRDGQSVQGRTYTITYSATDASGNKATATAQVTVPHDQGN
ncbi:MAG: hypothetical protein ABIQ54_00935 [Gammaproteobacteria bacterium]